MSRRTATIAIGLVATLALSNAGASGQSAERALDSSTAAAAMPAPRVSPRVRKSYVVPASIPADCSADVSQRLRNWIARLPNRSKVSFPTGGCYQVEGTLELRNRSSLIFEGNGVTLRSSTPPAEHRAIWRVIDSRDIVFHNMKVHGPYMHGGTHDAALQYAHAFDLRGTSAEIAGVKLTDLAGDCVYFGRGFSAGKLRSSGLVHDMTCLRVSRNAVSVTAGDDILIENVITDAIGLTAFDIEPNAGPGWGSRRVAVRDSTIGSYFLYAYALIGNAAISDQSFIGNRAIGSKPRIGILGKIRPQRITIRNNHATPSDSGGLIAESAALFVK